VARTGQRRALIVSAGVLVAIALLASGSARVAVAASPSPSDEVVTPNPLFDSRTEGLPANPWDIWLDAALPTDAPAGSSIRIGFMAWDREQHSVVSGYALSGRIWDRSGEAPPYAQYAKQDWAGHGYVELVVPAGGEGRIEFGNFGRVERLHGDVYAIAGVGPPPEAPLTLVATSQITARDVLAAGRPARVEITLLPRVNWPSGALKPPTTLALRARIPRGGSVAEVPATLTDPDTLTYEATIAIPDPGVYVLEAATGSGAEGSDVFATAALRVNVAPGAASPLTGTTSAGAPASPSTAPDLLPVVGVVLLSTIVLASLGAVVRREW
jgi:hypothetical protein